MSLPLMAPHMWLRASVPLKQYVQANGQVEQCHDPGGMADFRGVKLEIIL